MASSSPHRWLKGLVLVLVLLALAWSAAWFGLRTWIDGRAEAALAALQSRGIAVTCPRRAYSGFPFAIDAACPKFAVIDKAHDFELSAEAARAGLSVFSPTVLKNEIASPFAGRLGKLHVNATWQRLAANTRLATDGFETLQIVGNEVDIRTELGSLSFASGDVRARPVNQGDLEIAGFFNALAISDELGSTLPQANAKLNAVLFAAHQKVLVQRVRPIRWLRENGKADIRHLVISVDGGGQFAVAGVLEAHNDGTVSGDVTVGMADVEAFSRFVAEAAPDLAPTLAGIAQGLAVLGQPATLGEQEFSAIPIKIDRSKVRVGFFEVGRLPPLWR